MKELLGEYDLKLVEDNNISLPNLEEALEEMIKRIAPLYKEFIERGKFYDYKFKYEFGRQYVYIFESDGYGEPYETIEDWSEELTGERKFNFYGYGELYESYLDLIREKIREYVEELIGDYLSEFDEVYLLENELEDEILDLPITVLESAINNGC
jgi:hypothetical protein